MKRLMPVIAILIAFFFVSCASKVQNKQVKRSDTLMMEALYVTDPTTLALAGGPVKQVIQADFIQKVDSTNKDKIIVTKEFVQDTFYLLPTVDTTLLIKDQKGVPVLSKDGQKQFLSSFRHPLFLHKSFLSPLPIYFPNLK